MTGGTFGAQAVSDVAFLQDGDRNFLLVAGSVDNELVVADMDDGFKFEKVSLSTNPEATAAGNRQVEWAIGTDYVWVNGGQTEEMYIVKLGKSIEDSKVVKTLDNVPDGKVIFVKNYEREAQMSELAKMMKVFTEEALTGVVLKDP